MKIIKLNKMSSVDAVANDSTSKPSIRFSVKDILDLPTIKRSSSGQPIKSDGLSNAPGLLASTLESSPGAFGEGLVSTNPYAAVYYASDNPYTRWLPPGEMFSYSSPPLCK